MTSRFSVEYSRRTPLAGAALVLLLACAMAAHATDNNAEATPSAAQIVARNNEARGGLAAWRKIHAMLWSGHIARVGAATGDAPQFVLAMQRPNKTRFELITHDQRYARIFDGKQGWKLHMTANGVPELQAYDDEERSFAADGQGFDGPLIDSAAKGNQVTLEGVDQVEGQRAYRLKVSLASGAAHHVWVDAQSFLDIKYDRPTRAPRPPAAAVEVFNRDFKAFDGVQVPMTLETQAGSGAPADRMVLDKVEINPSLDARMFDKPAVPEQHGSGHTAPRRVDAPRPPPAATPAPTTALPAPPAPARANAH